jgi:hypothetical protein
MVTVTDKTKSKVEQLKIENKLDDSYFLRVSVQAGVPVIIQMDFDNKKAQ